MINDKLSKVTGSFNGEFFDIKIDKIVDEHQTASLQKEETRNIIKQTKLVFRNFLITADKKKDADVSVFKLYKLFIQRELQIYSTLNMFREVGSISTGLFWVPNEDNFANTLNDMVSRNNFKGVSHSIIDQDGLGLMVPTSFQDSEFMWVF